MGALENHPNLIQKPSTAVIVSTVGELNALNSAVTELTISNNSFNTAASELRLSRYKRLKRIVIGNECFRYVNVFNITGLSELESVEIGMNSFTKKKNDYGSDPNRHFYVKNCPKLKSLKMGRYSFSDYTVVEIEDVDALEVIEMGELNNLNEDSYNFYSASLELKSILILEE